MSAEPDKLSSIPPLGKSVEEVEAGEDNRVNPPARGEGPHDDADTVAPLVIANPSSQGVPGNFTSGSAPIIGPTTAVGAHLDDEVNGPGQNTED